MPLHWGLVLAADTLELVIFVVAGRRYGLPAAAVLSVCHHLRDLPADLPASPLRRLLGDRRGASPVHLVLHRHRSPACAWAVDEVSEVGRYPLRSLQPLPWPLPAQTSAGIFGLLPLDDGLVPLLDPEHLLTAAEAAPRRRRARP